MIQMAHALLARAARHLFLQLNFARKEGVGPGDVRWAKERDYGSIERRREVPRTAIGAYEQIAPLDASLRQAN